MSRHCRYRPAARSARAVAYIRRISVCMAVTQSNLWLSLRLIQSTIVNCQTALKWATSALIASSEPEQPLVRRRMPGVCPPLLLIRSDKMYEGIMYESVQYDVWKFLRWHCILTRYSSVKKGDSDCIYTGISITNSYGSYKKCRRTQGSSFPRTYFRGGRSQHAIRSSSSSVRRGRSIPSS